MAEAPAGIPRRAVFLDRDGTVVEDADYLREPAQLRLLPGAAEAIRRLRQAGFLLILATNQSGVARGFISEEKLREVHAALQEMLRAEGAPLDAIYYCPHLPQPGAAPCDCRKPAPGLLLRAAREWRIDLARSFAIGDAERDVEAGRRAGCRTVRISPQQQPATAADAVAASLLDAAALVLNWRPNP